MLNTISSDLSAQLQQLAELANNQDLSPADKKTALEKAGAKTLAEINAEMPSLNFTSTKFAEKIAKLITDGNFDRLPLPAKMSTDLQALRLVATALQDNANTMSIDVSSIMRLLMEAQRTLSTINTDSQIQNRSLKLQAAKNEFDAKAAANQQQLTADLLTSCADIVMGAVQLTGSAISLAGAVKNIDASSEVLDDAKKLSELTDIKKTSQQEFADAGEDLKSIKAEVAPKIKQLSDKVKAGTANFEEEFELKSLQGRLAKCEKNFKQSQIAYKNAESNENALSQKIDSKNLAIKASTQKYEGFQQIMTSSGTILKGIMQSIGAVYTFRAATDRLDADKQGLAKDMAAQSEQSAQEGSRNMMEGQRTTIQSLSAIEQSINSSMTATARA
jgi:hypothetical protein